MFIEHFLIYVVLMVNKLPNQINISIQQRQMNPNFWLPCYQTPLTYQNYFYYLNPISAINPYIVNNFNTSQSYPVLFQLGQNLDNSEVQNSMPLPKQPQKNFLKRQDLQCKTLKLQHTQNRIQQGAKQENQQDEENNQSLKNELSDRSKSKKLGKKYNQGSYGKRNTESNIANQILSFLRLSKRSQAIVSKILREKEEVSLYYHYLCILKSKHKQMNKKQIAKLCEMRPDSDLYKILEKRSLRFDILSIETFASTVRKMVNYFLKKICPATVLHSNKISKKFKINNLERRREFIKTVQNLAIHYKR